LAARHSTRSAFSASLEGHLSTQSRPSAQLNTDVI
jgi:hypothetical protein